MKKKEAVQHKFKKKRSPAEDRKKKGGKEAL
jgi:hypothetical protein